MRRIETIMQDFAADPLMNACPLSELTSVGFGGPAERLARPNSVAELQTLLREARLRQIPVRALGRGTNVFAADEGVRGLVIAMGSPRLSRIDVDGRRLTAGAGAPLRQVIRTAIDRGLAGLEGLVGIPGSVGGALVMNAGAAGKAVGDRVAAVTAIDRNGTVRRLDRSEITFGYRRSSLRGLIVAEACFELERSEPGLLRRRAADLLRQRRMSQPAGRSAGCVCKNPPGHSAGQLIDEAGLKGTRVGGMVISDRHANFFINVDRATFDDASRLIEMARRRVLRRFGIELELEVDMWMDRGPQAGTL